MEVNTTQLSTTPHGQMDSGANTNVTNNKCLLKHYQNIQRIPVTGIGNGPACYITGYGYMDMMTTQGDWLTIKMYYAPSCSNTIISPNAIVQDHPFYTSWTQHSHLDEGTATIHFYNKTVYHMRKTIKMHKKNNLWFITQPLVPTIQRASLNPSLITHTQIYSDNATIRSLTSKEAYEVWHQRLLHPSNKIMANLSECIDGIPSKLDQPHFHHCDICAEAKGTKHNNSNPQVHQNAHRTTIPHGLWFRVRQRSK